MSNELLINVTPSERRVALVENGLLQEVHLERADDISYVGNIYFGKVERVLPGMQAAFVNIGLSRTAFLHAGEIARPRPELSAALDDELVESTVPPISELIREGQNVLVQVVKDPMGSKGARLTTQLSLPSRFLVYLPGVRSVGVSLRIDNEEERSRLRALVEDLLGADDETGLIVRTNAEGVGREELERDLFYLRTLWRDLERRMSDQPKPGDCIYEDLSLPLRAIRDLMHGGIDRVRIDDPTTLRQAQAFAATFVAEWADRIDAHAGTGPVFDLFGVEDEIERALKREVPLKSGGHLTIDQTEAMTTVDVNTGGYVGVRNFDETVFKTNMEAAQALARQLRLRNLGGIVIVDFIDMTDEEHKRQVLRMLQQALARDPARTSVSEISPLGLVEMTRKRTTESLEHRLCEPCPHCNGRGWQKSVDSVCSEIFREILRAVRQFETGRLMVMASPQVVDKILEDHTRTVAELTEQLGTSIRFQPEEQYGQEQFDVVLL
ncbi:ribonuclease G [Wenzhouxiangella sp. XN79A]|uniref:ribonuclease G n=1 Tax=Wenzhouxiangella sp. XN79A TaxID=2724193 RepID=UPI00144A8C6C|nr:ribonuclease G [Wenzhouxiangella sp. XN79A]